MRRSHARATASLSAFSVSPDGRYLAYGVSTGGSDRQRFRVKDLTTGEVLRASATENPDVFEVARVGRFKKGSGLPLRIPVIEMVEIGAGGGSIAWISPEGALKVGPQSAGADQQEQRRDRSGAAGVGSGPLHDPTRSTATSATTPTRSRAATSAGWARPTS